jgi:Tfp pilus assembly protein PilO
MKRLAWTLTRWLARMGWTGAAGLGLFAFAAVFCASAVVLRLEERSALKAQAEELRARYRLAQVHPEAVKPGKERQLRSFYAIFPHYASLPDWLARINAAAQTMGLSLDLGEYSLAQERGAMLARYQITLPVKGNYRQIRGFIGEVLREVPASSLDDIALRREAIGSELLDARIKLTLYVKAPGT